MSSCDSPIPRETLARYWLGDLETDEEMRLEEHLMDCDACDRESAGLAALVHGLRKLDRSDGLLPVVAPSLRAELDAEGFRLTELEARAGETTEILFSPGLEVVLLRLPAPVRTDQTYALEMVSASGRQILRMDSIPVDAERQEVIVACQRHYPSAFPGSTDASFRIINVGAQSESLVAEYPVHHTVEDGPT